MNKKIIFIHTLFRTGSKYIWNRFRQSGRYYCFYEPLHQVLSEVTLKNIDQIMTKSFKNVHHPEMGEYYLKEYKPLLNENQTGLNYFKKEFSFDQFCYNKKNLDLKRYIDELITVQTIKYLPNKEYDRLLCENIVIINLYDSSANNTIIECMVRNTPILVNPIEPVVEYLGKDYPFYFNSLEEAAIKAEDFDLIYETHRFLVKHPLKEKLSGKYFLRSFMNSEIYKKL